MKARKLKVTISGSFNHHYNEILDLHDSISKNNTLKILSPADMTIRDQTTDFMLLKSDKSNRIDKIEDSHLQAINKSSLLFVVNPHNYIGISTALEIGFAKIKNIPIVYSEKNIDKKFIITDFPKDYLFIENKNGNVSIKDAHKIGYAYATNIPVIFSEEPSDILLSRMIKKEQGIIGESTNFKLLTYQNTNSPIFRIFLRNNLKRILYI